MSEYETISINIEKSMKRKLEEYNFFHKNNKINLSAISRDALKKELEKRSQDPRTKKPEKNTRPQEKKGKEITCLNCGTIFTAKRSTRKFCSNKCKTAFYRK